MFARHLRTGDPRPGPGWESRHSAPTAEKSRLTRSRHPAAVHTWRKSYRWRGRLTARHVHGSSSPHFALVRGRQQFYCCSAGPSANSQSTVPSTCPPQTRWVKVPLHRNIKLRSEQQCFVQRNADWSLEINRLGLYLKKININLNIFELDPLHSPSSWCNNSNWRQIRMSRNEELPLGFNVCATYSATLNPKYYWRYNLLTTKYINTMVLTSDKFEGKTLQKSKYFLDFIVLYSRTLNAH